MRRRTLCFALVMLSLSSALEAQTQTATRADVVKFVRAYIDVSNRADIDAAMVMMSRNPMVSSVASGEITRGWDAIRKEADEMVGSEGSFKVSIGSMDVSMLGSANALVLAPVTLALATENGPAEARGAMTLVLEKKAGKWLVLNEHYSIKLPE